MAYSTNEYRTELTLGQIFIKDNVWLNPNKTQFYLLLGDKVETVDNGFKSKVLAMPAPDNRTHYVLPIRYKYMNIIRELDDHCRLCYALNQILPWDIIEKLVPYSYMFWKKKIREKEEARVLNERNRLARLEKRELAARMANKPVGQFAREDRALQMEKLEE